MFNCLLRRLHLLPLILTFSIFPTAAGFAQTSTDITLVLQPHCTQEELNDDWILGEVPDIPSMVTLGEGHCADFEVESPQMLRTPPMSLGDTLDLDVVIKNPEEKEIQRARVWLLYDPNILQGVSIDVHPDLPQVAPGEEDFDVDQGYAMIDASAEEGDEPSNQRVVVARVKFTVKETVPGGAIIGFHDIQQDGHTLVLKKDDSDPNGVSALTNDPGSLHVIFGREDGETCQNDSDCLVGTCIQGKCTQSGKLPDGAACTIDSQCESEQCNEGICGSGNQTPPTGTGGVQPQPNGSICTDASECESLFCFEGFCRANGDIPDSGACEVDQECISGGCIEGFCNLPVPQEPQETTAFSLLQVQNLGVTTQGVSVYLGWDALQSSRLKAYNIYYGTTTGRYIQRKTVEGSMTSLVLHSLPEGTTYYFAIRAVSTDDEESAFSNEVSVTVGNPASSTAPFTADISGLEPAPPNPVQGGNGVPGATGAPSIMVFLLFASAIIGTIFASRRQLVASVKKPTS